MKRKIRDTLIWLVLLCKRLLKKPVFVVLLLMIPLSVVAVKMGVSDNSGVLNIGLYSDGGTIGDEIVKKLLSRDSIISFREYPSEEDARKAVIEDKIQGAWIFPKDISETIAQNAQYAGANPLVKVIEREETLSLKLSHELLYGCLHPYVVYGNYTVFAERKYGDKAPSDEETLRYYFENGTPPAEILTVKVVGEEENVEINNNLLTLPLRGILSLMCVLCGLACMMYFLSDKKSGKFDWLPAQRHIVPAFGQCFSGVLLCAITVMTSVYLLGIGTRLTTEIVAMLLYIFCVCGFCLILGLIFGSAARLGTVAPFIMILMLVQCPIFMTDTSYRPIWFLFPPSYYLYAISNKAYMVYMAIYAVTALGVTLIINWVSLKNSKLLS